MSWHHHVRNESMQPINIRNTNLGFISRTIFHRGQIHCALVQVVVEWSLWDFAHAARQRCCRSICKILYRYYILHLRYIKINFPSNCNYYEKTTCAIWFPDHHSSCRCPRTWWCQAIFEYSTKHSVTRESLLWRHNRCNGVSNHQPYDCLLNRLFRRRSKKTSNSASLAFVRGIHRWPVNSPHIRPVTRKMFPFDEIIVMIRVFDYLKLNTFSQTKREFSNSLFQGQKGQCRGGGIFVPAVAASLCLNDGLCVPVFPLESPLVALGKTRSTKNVWAGNAKVYKATFHRFIWNIMIF